MIAVDTNILVYAHRSDSPWHDAAKSVVLGLAEDASIWSIPWPCVHEFLAVVTNPKVHRPATPMALAIDQIDAWFECGRLVFIAETAMHWRAIKTLLIDGRAVAAQAHDARIAAICLQHGVDELWTADRDFARFTALKTRNPLVR